ncbi:MAG: phosphoenolpyruvate carboxykinase (GTP) [Deltaproteobacteria bacterium]|nr:phosphoenolpyruvate carboxykinase (GTP) [Deltaproteobacteria bacterium]
MKVIHQEAVEWVEELTQKCQPDEVVWIDGSEEQKEQLEEEAFATGELVKLDQGKWPRGVYHRTDPRDVARTEESTFICTTLKEDAGPTNNWMSPLTAYRKADEVLKGSMRGRSMYVIPFSMGPVGSPFSKIGIEITDSIYVVLNMIIMTIVGEEVVTELGTNGIYTKCIHSKAGLDPKKRLILHFPEDNAIISVNSGYGGNVLLGKKCLALRIATHQARNEGWLAEHMLIMGIEEPNGRIQYLAGAFPSACGKTNLAMLVPPRSMQSKGYRIWTVGDDIGWMRIDTDGGLWAINPESGFFGVLPGTNEKTNPNAMATMRKNSIFTNVVLGEDSDIWWEGCDWEPPQPAWDWKGRPWKPDMKDESGVPIVGAHPNSRFTAPISQNPSSSFRREHHHGVQVTAILFGGRRARLAPLVYEAFNWQHGVFMGGIMASERTAAQYGAIGEVRRDPMAMLPFCGYNMADYFEHWLRMGVRMKRKMRPRIFHVNWFRTDENGDYLWPGFGENLRVLEWILARCRGEVEATSTPIGYVPRPEDLDLDGLDMSETVVKDLFQVNHQDWLEEANGIEEFFKQFGDRLPTEMWAQLEGLRRRLDVMEER